jgi:hypothetical protein
LGGFLFMFGLVEYPFFRDNLIANSSMSVSQMVISAGILV